MKLFYPCRSEQITPNTTDQLERVALKFNEDLQQKLLSTRTASDQALKFRVVELCALIQRISAVELYTHLRSGLQRVAVGHREERGCNRRPINAAKSLQHEQHAHGYRVHGGPQ